MGFGFGKKKNEGLRLPVHFKAQIDRQIAGGKTLTFNVFVKGYFVGRRGEPAFEATEITVDGAPDMDLRSFSPNELQSINGYALSVVFPKVTGQTKQS
jgi:hypothetical protein